jgi:hypothetical protein
MKKLSFLFALMMATSFTIQAQSVVAKRAFNSTLKAYFDTKNALATDNAAQANERAKALVDQLTDFPIKTLTTAQQLLWKTEVETMKKAATLVATEQAIKEQRKSFWAISSAMIKLVKAFNMNSAVAYIQYCPMVKKSWLNDVEAVQNPFYGSMMYDCGEVTETIAKK